MSKTLGMIETKGLISSIVALDTMLKSANVELVKQEKIGGAFITIVVKGDVGAVQAALEAGVESASRVGEVVASHIIPHPDDDIAKLFETKEVKAIEKVKKIESTKTKQVKAPKETKGKADK